MATCGQRNGMRERRTLVKLSWSDLRTVQGSKPSDETIQRLYGFPSKENYIGDQWSQDRQESSFLSQSVE